LSDVKAVHQPELQRGQASLLAYPNPTHGSLTITRSGSQGAAMLQVLNAHGQAVRELELSHDQATVELHGLLPGSYICRMQSEYGHVLCTKLLVN